MKKVLLFLSLFLFLKAGGQNAAGISLSGVVINSQTGDSIPGASIYIPDLKTGTISGSNGAYRIERLPRSRVLIQVSLMGYRIHAEVLDLSEVSVKNFYLEESVTELNEVVVTGLSQAAEKNRTPVSMTTIPHKELLQSSSGNIIDALASHPGISQISTGPGISKPVIRGLGYNRVVTVNDGIRQEGQQWGDEHGTEIDEASVDKAEIIKGPASIAYGSDALAGVISLISAPPAPEGSLQGSILAGYQSNNGLRSFSGNFSGNKKGFIWDLRYGNKAAHSYRNHTDGYVFNSGFRENSIRMTTGLNKAWGYAHLQVSAYNFMPGITEGTRDSLTGKFTKPVALNDSSEGYITAMSGDFKSYTPHVPYQEVGHYKIQLNNHIAAGSGSIKVILGMQQNRRQEYGNVLHPDSYGLYFLLNTFNYDVRYVFPERKNFNVSAGINGMRQFSYNKGSEFLIPEYDLSDLGIFATAGKNIGKLDLSGGLRYDYRTIRDNELYLNSLGEKTDPGNPAAVKKFNAFHASYPGTSASLGATWQFSPLVFGKINMSRGFRAPNIAETGSNGIHEGSFRYENGNQGLNAEKSLQLDFATGINSRHITAEADIFRNAIKDYIFLSKMENLAGKDSVTQGLPAFRFMAGDAVLSGSEVIMDIHPHPFDWLHFENTFSYVIGVLQNQQGASGYLPLIPPARLTSEIMVVSKKGWKSLSSAYAEFRAEKYFTQEKFYAAAGTETATPGYLLFNAGAGCDVTKGGRKLFSLFLNIANLSDADYQSHLSRLKYAPVNPTTGKTGICNMGRNITLRIYTPLDFKKANTPAP